MAPTRKSRSLNKRFSYTNEVSPIRHGESADRRIQKKRKLSDMLGPQWSKEDLERFYESYRKHGKDWKKVGAVMQKRSTEMVEALYTMNRAYLSLPEGTASVAGLIAMMTDHYCNLAGSDSEQESNDGAGTSQKPQKNSQGKQPKTSKGSDGRLSSHSHIVASSYDCRPLLKKKRSGGSRPRVVGKRTPRFPVSYSFENVNGQKYFSPTRQGLEFKFDANDDEVAHEMLIVLAEASQRGGSRTPKRMVGGSDIDEDGLEGRMEPDNGDISRDKSHLMKTESIGALSQKGIRLYGKKFEADSTKDNHPYEIREACSGAEGQIVGVDRGKSYIEVTDANIARSSSQGLRKRSKSVIFRRDEGSAFNALQTLADLSLRMPESTNNNDSFVQIKEESNEVDKTKSLEAMPANHQKAKHQLLGFKIKGNHLVSGSERVIDKSSQPGKVSVHDVSPSPEAKQETHQSTITKVSRKKQKTMASKISKAEAQSDGHMNESQEAGARDVGKKSTSKGKRSSQSASPKLVKHPENSSSNADRRKEGHHSAVLTADVPVTDQVDIITKVRNKRKMKLQKPQIFADSKLLDKTEKLSHCFSNHRARRWCAFEWFYSAIDYPWFAKREFVEYLFHVGLGHVPRLTHVEWGVIRSSLGKPRRYSEQFLKEEKEKLNQYRDSVRTHYTELRSGTREGLPTDLARPLSVGQRVIAIHPKTREFHDGSVLTVDHNRCRVQFDLPELGVEFVMDIDCMPLNPLENMPTSLVRHTVAVDKFLENFNELKMNGHTKDQGEGYIKFSSGENLENMDVDPNMLLATYPACNLLKQAKLASGIAISQAKMGPKENPTNQQTSYSQPCSRAQIEAKEADVQALAELTRALEKKKALVSELGQMNNDVLENRKDGECALKDSEPFKKQYAAVVIQLQEANERVSSALYCLRQRNTYQGSLPWPRSVTNIGDSGCVLSSFSSEIHSEESGSHVNEIVESSRSRARTMVNSAIQAFSSMKVGENTFEKIEEAIDYVNDQLSLDDPYMPAGRSFVASDHGNFALQEQTKSRTLVSSLQAVSTSPQLKNPSPVPSELITKCVATLLMIQKCTERQFPPADVAQILDSAVTSLQPCCSQNLPVYADIEKCMIMIRNQIMALIPT